MTYGLSLVREHLRLTRASQLVLPEHYLTGRFVTYGAVHYNIPMVGRPIAGRQMSQVLAINRH